MLDSQPRGIDRKMYDEQISYNEFDDKDEFNIYHYEYIKIPIDTINIR